jgi:dihydrofolate reductase
MRKVILSMSMSLDGYVASERQHPGAPPEDDELVARGDLATEIAAIKEEPGPDVIAWGGAIFAAALVAGNLIDEYRLAIQPVAVGTGQALFGQLPVAQHLDLIEATTT